MKPTPLWPRPRPKPLGMTAEAEGILAVGRAEATAKQLMIDSYKTAGPDAYAKIQIAASLAEGTKGIQGYLPNNFNPTIISGNFMDSIQAILDALNAAGCTAWVARMVAIRELRKFKGTEAA